MRPTGRREGGMDAAGKEATRAYLMNARKRMKDIYRHMLEELESVRPHTIKVPGRHGGYIRVPCVRNPEWYRDLCGRHQAYRINRRYRRPRTIIRRCDVVSYLKRLIEGDESGEYARRVIEVALEYSEAIRRVRKESST